MKFVNPQVTTELTQNTLNEFKKKPELNTLIIAKTPITNWEEIDQNYGLLENDECISINEILIHAADNIENLNEQEKIGYFSKLANKYRLASHTKTKHHCNKTIKNLNISLCITCGNRTEHLEKTTPPNLKVIEEYGKEVEIILLDYGTTDPDELSLFCKKIEKLIPVNASFLYHRVAEPYAFAKSKNVAHNLATKDIIINLDADNYITEQYLNFIYKSFNLKPLSIAFFQWEDKYLDLIKNTDFDPGFMGRIAVNRALFKASGGYEEAIIGYGEDDTEFKYRVTSHPNVQAIIMNDIPINWGSVIPMDKKERIDLLSDRERTNIKTREELLLISKSTPIYAKHKTLKIRPTKPINIITKNKQFAEELINILRQHPQYKHQEILVDTKEQKDRINILIREPLCEDQDLIELSKNDVRTIIRLAKPPHYHKPFIYKIVTA